MFMLRVASFLGYAETKPDSQEAMLFRMMIPILKLYTAKQSIQVVGEGMELFGGLGYIESSNIPVIFRDVLVTSIWEGTTNVLSYDVLRVLMPKAKDQAPWDTFAFYVSSKFSRFL